MELTNSLISFLYMALQVATAVFAILFGFGAMYLVYLYARTVVDARTIKIASVLLGLITLIGVGIGIREYPAYLMRNATEGFNNLAAESPAFRGAVNSFAGQMFDEIPNTSNPYGQTTFTDETTIIITSDPHAGGGIVSTPTLAPEQFPTAGPAPGSTPEPTFTPTSMLDIAPTATATIDVVLLATQNAAQVTRYPTNTPVPTIDTALWNPQTPAPTPQPGG